MVFIYYSLSYSIKTNKLLSPKLTRKFSAYSYCSNAGYKELKLPR